MLVSHASYTILIYTNNATGSVTILATYYQNNTSPTSASMLPRYVHTLCTKLADGNACTTNSYTKNNLSGTTTHPAFHAPKTMLLPTTGATSSFMTTAPTTTRVGRVELPGPRASVPPKGSKKPGTMACAIRRTLSEINWRGGLGLPKNKCWRGEGRPMRVARAAQMVAGGRKVVRNCWVDCQRR